MLGKKKCKMLREIRKTIAEKNDITYVTEECHYKGDCKGTCPKCEAEVIYLENELRKREALGKKVMVAGIATCIALGSSGCALTDKEEEIQGDMEIITTQESTADTTQEITTEAAAASNDETEETLEGDVVVEE